MAHLPPTLVWTVCSVCWLLVSTSDTDTPSGPSVCPSLITYIIIIIISYNPSDCPLLISYIIIIISYNPSDCPLLTTYIIIIISYILITPLSIPCWLPTSSSSSSTVITPLPVPHRSPTSSTLSSSVITPTSVPCWSPTSSTVITPLSVPHCCIINISYNLSVCASLITYIIIIVSYNQLLDEVSIAFITISITVIINQISISAFIWWMIYM